MTNKNNMSFKDTLDRLERMEDKVVKQKQKDLDIFLKNICK